MSRMAVKQWALVICVAGLALAQKRVITHEDVFLMKRVGEPVASPNGKLIVVPVTEPAYEAGKQISDLWLVPTDGSVPPRRLTSAKGTESDPAWSPDSTRIAFSAKRDGDEFSQIYVLTLGGGEAERVTSAPTGAANPQWRPDGKALLFESMVDPIAAERKARKYNARTYDSFPIRFWNAWLDEKRPHIFVQELGSDKSVDLLANVTVDATFGGLGGDPSLHPVWSPDGSSIVYVAMTNRAEAMYAETESHLFRISAQGGTPVQLTERGQSFSNPQFSPKGDALYAEHQRNPVKGGRLYSLTRIARISWPNPGKATMLTDGWDRSASSFHVADDGSIYLDAEDDGFDKLFRLAPGAAKPELLFAVKEGGYTGPAMAGDKLIARYGSSTQPPEVVVVNVARGMHSYLTNFNAERVAQIDWRAPEHFWFTAKNGRKIHSIVTLPPNFNASQKYPLVVFPHGGPNAMSKDAFSTRWNFHLLTSPGYVLLQTNYTGSTGFGEKFADDIERDVLRGPAEEILEAITEAGKRYPYIDLTRQASIGASYGGYLMNWFEGHTNQFKCLVNHAGAINNESQYGVNDGGFTRELRMGVPIWEKGGQWNDQSPIRYSGNFKTPMLITQGELDFRVPLSESMTTYKILLRRKVPARLILFPEEGHWILRGENSRYHMQEVLGWLKKWL